MNKILYEQPQALPKCYSEELQAFIFRLLTKDPDQRSTIEAVCKQPQIAQQVHTH